jgi:hypothetical protein
MKTRRNSQTREPRIPARSPSGSRQRRASAGAPNDFSLVLCETIADIRHQWNVFYSAKAAHRRDLAVRAAIPAAPRRRGDAAQADMKARVLIVDATAHCEVGQSDSGAASVYAKLCETAQRTTLLSKDQCVTGTAEFRFVELRPPRPVLREDHEKNHPGAAERVTVHLQGAKSSL